MPTREFFDRFWEDYRQLTPRQRARFRVAVDALIEDLAAKRQPRPGLRASGLRGYPGVWELSLAPSGRATFHFGGETIPGEAH